MPHKSKGDRQRYEKERAAERKNDPDRVELMKAARRRWYEKHRAEKAFRDMMKRKYLGAINEMKPGEWTEMVNACGNRCIVAGCGASPVTRDHVIPLSKGGRHHISNLQPLCRRCNASKGTNVTDYRGT